MPADVREVIERSHSSRASYSVTLTVDVVVEGKRRIEKNSEFQSGVLHRVEVPSARVLMNCETGEQHMFDVEQAKFVQRPEVSSGACGIAVGADEVISGRMLKPITGTFGPADVIELVGEKFVRRYAVTPDGIIVSNSYEPRSSDTPFTLRTLSTQVTRGPLTDEMFKPNSLAKSFAPAEAQ